MSGTSEVVRFARLPSTQSEARRRASEGAPTGTVIVAREQEKGEGRVGHVWASPPGGLYLSWIVPEPPQGLSLVPLSAALSLRSLVMVRYGVRSQIRWPNDLWVLPGPHHGGKVAGVIVDRVERGPRAVLVLGIGVNANARRSAFPEELRESVACLHEWSEGEIDLDELEEALLHDVGEGLARLDTADGARRVAEECRSALEGVGRRVRIDGRPVGVLRDLADDGALVVEGTEGPEEHRSGTLEFEPEGASVA